MESLKRARNDCAAEDMKSFNPVLIVGHRKRIRDIAIIFYQRKMRVNDVQVRVEDRLGHAILFRRSDFLKPG
ncbi:hypothetical protein HMPREF0281_00644 [Corynebacterium ammoniagenes DSM 20306]|uniref:Uncharacterized protein n=1 Tax=Corynebacterium ammoniagenes DSM 20306 TaxID=649754 RepID=A0ABN0AGC7_CORAM|nr:hypothetical protein HMPREF0281_00644 [Corynebacterium ammoniagenes DSM 20306]